MASSGGSLVPEKRGNAGNQVDTPEVELYGRENEARNHVKSNTAGQANPKAAQPAAQRMQQDDYRNMQALEHTSNNDQVPPISYPTS